jgi:hypothetical protein
MQWAFGEWDWIDNVSVGQTETLASHPQAKELFLEVGLALAVTFSGVGAMDLLLTLLNIPNP